MLFHLMFLIYRYHKYPQVFV